MQKIEFLECAVIRSTHGINGNVRLENRCNSTNDLCKLKRVFIKDNDEYIEHKILNSFTQKTMVVASIESIDSVEKAAALRDTVLYANRSDFKLSKDEIFIVDILGLPIIDNITGKTLGSLKEVIKPGAQQIYVVKTESGEFMIPVVKEFVKNISDGSYKPEGIYVELIEGMID